MIAIINGPNLNLTGRREPDIYGTQTFESYFESLAAEFPAQNLSYFQSNSEGAIIDHIHQVGFDPQCCGIVINPGAYAHYSYAIADALRAVPVAKIEVHISNIHAREGFRAVSVTAPTCRGVIAGLGLSGYRLAVEALNNLQPGRQ